jgi:hypothetical protein
MKASSQKSLPSRQDEIRINMLISSFFIIERILEVGNDDAIRWVLRSYPQQDQLNQNARFKDILLIYSGVYGSAFVHQRQTAHQSTQHPVAVIRIIMLISAMIAAVIILDKVVPPLLYS